MDPMIITVVAACYLSFFVYGFTVFERHLSRMKRIAKALESK